MKVLTNWQRAWRPITAGRRGALFALGLLLSGTGAVPAAAVPIANGGFESGDFSGWTLSGQTAYLEVTDLALHVSSGSYAAMLGPYRTTGSLSQTLTVVPEATYEISFWLSSDYYSVIGRPSSSFEVFFDGTKIYSNVNALDFQPTEIVLTATAGSDTTAVLEFRARNDLFFWGLDDVGMTCAGGCSVPTAVDEPQSLMLLGLAVALAGLARRQRAA